MPKSRPMGRAATAALDDAVRAQGSLPAHALKESASEVAVIGFDETAQIRFINDRAEHVFGYCRDEAVGAPVDFLIPGLMRELRLASSHIEGEDPAVRMPIRLGPLEALRQGAEPLKVSLYVEETLIDGRRTYLAIVGRENDAASEEAGAGMAAHRQRLREEEWLLLQAAPFPLVLTSIEDGTILYANRRALDLFKTAPESAFGRNVSNFYDAAEARAKLLGELEEKGSATDLLTHLRDGDGNDLWVLMSAQKVIYRGRPAILSSYNDITERRRAEIAQRASELRLGTVIENAPVILFAVDREGRFTFAEGKGLEPLGVSPGDVSGLSLFDVVDEEIARPMLDRVLGGETVPARTRAGARIFDNTSSPLRNEKNEIVGMIGVATDVTDRVEAQRSLETAQARTRKLIESALDMITIIGSDGVISFQSPSVQKVLGYHADEIVDTKLYDYIHPDDLVAARAGISATMRSTQLIEGLELRLRHKDGSWRWIEAISRNLSDDPVIRGVVVNSRDVTERKRIEASYLRARDEAESANRAKSSFLAHMSHELRTPLNAIIGFAEMMRQETFGPLGSDRYRTYIDDIHASGHHLLNVINDILDLSRIEAGQMELVDQPVDIREVARWAIDMALARPDIEARLDVSLLVPHDLPGISADERSLRQILLNLLSNAVKFTDDGGRISVESFLEMDGAIVVKVSDTGVGIPRHMLEAVQRPFLQAENSLSRRQEGTGLGLAITRSLVELHGGRLILDSAPGAGTTVTLIFPRERVLRHSV